MTEDVELQENVKDSKKDKADKESAAGRRTETKTDSRLVKWDQIKYLFFTRWKIWEDARFLLFCLCVAGIVQGMIFTNVVISSIERRFGYDSTQSGIIAGSYDMGSLIAVIPVTYFGGRPGSSKPKVIAMGMAVIGTGSLIFSLPHFLTSRYVDLIAIPVMDANNATRVNLQTHNDVMEDFSTNRICKFETPKTEEEILQNIYCDSSAREEKLSSIAELHNYKYVFILGQLLHGIGASALITLGTTLLDESVKKKVAPVYIGIFETSFVLGPAIGYVVGGRLLSIFTEFYLLDASSQHLMTTLTPTSPQWVGAWWLGFLLIVVLAFFCSIVLSLFPAKMSTAQILQVEQTKDPQGLSTENNNNNQDFSVNRCDYGSLKDMPKAVLALIMNKTYMSISIGASLDAFLLAGMAAFLPKYLEYQFGLTSGQAAMLVGAIIVPAGAGGTLLGGYLLKRFNMGRKKCLQFYIICQLIILPLYLGFLFNCPTQPYAGVNVDTPESSLQLTTSCNQACQCNVNPTSGEPLAVTSPFYEPVCHLPSSTTYFSACLAGCTSFSSVGQTNVTVFHHCACIPLPPTDGTTPPADDVIPGMCPTECNHIYFSILLFLNVLFTFVATMPGLVALLRSVEHVQRSLCLGLQTILLRGIGTVPGPVVFGYIIDQTCLMWQTTVGKQDNQCDILEQETSSAAKGSCRVYDNVPMSVNVMAVILAWRFVGTIFFVMALYFSKTSPIKDEIDEPKSRVEAHGEG